MLDTSHNCHQFKLVSQGLDRPPHCAAGLDHLSVLVRVRLLSVTIVNNPEFCHYCHQFRLLSLLSDYKGFTDRHTVPPALTICPRSSEDEQSWRLPLASTLNIKLQKTSMSGFFCCKNWEKSLHDMNDQLKMSGDEGSLWHVKIMTEKGFAIVPLWRASMMNILAHFTMGKALHHRDSPFDVARV